MHFRIGPMGSQWGACATGSELGRRALCALALLQLAGCGTIALTEVIPDLTPAGRVGAPSPVATDAGACTPVTGADYDRLQSTLALSGVKARFDDILQALPPLLGRDKVVQELLQSAKYAIYSAQHRIGEQAKLPQTITDLSSTERGAFRPPDSIDEWDLRNFATSLRQALLSTHLSYGHDSTSTGSVTVFADPPVPPDRGQFTDQFVAYFSAYYEGNYVDRFGNGLSQPAVSLTIPNAEIAGAVQVFWELVLDYVLLTPVWVDGQGNYFPRTATSTAPPTAVAARPPLVTVQTLLNKDDSDKCGITPLKAEAIQYLARLAEDQASALGGLGGGSFGGIQVGLGILGKLSIGDNQTLQALAKTVIGKTFQRATEEASYRILYWMPYDKNAWLADLIQRYLDSQVKKQAGGS